jgi:3-phytase/alkaline phosphatase D
MSRRLLTVSLLTAAAAFVSSNLTARAADTFTDFLGVAAGDADASSAVVWTRASNSATGSVPLTVQYSTDSSFSTFSSYSLGLSGSPLASGGASSDYTAKTLLTGLSAGTNYFYRFTDNAGSLSNTGTFKTAPASNAKVAVRLGMSGDANGSWRPYTSTQNFQNEHLDAFVFLGDTIYETASGVSGSVNYSPAITFPSNTNNSISDATAAALRADMQKKYREQFIPVSTGSYPGLKNFFAAQGNYTLLDNHELGNRQYINGGAPAAATSGYTGTNFDTNTTGTFINQTTSPSARTPSPPPATPDPTVPSSSTAPPTGAPTSSTCSLTTAPIATSA